MAQSLIPITPEPAIVDVREQQASESISTAIAALRTQILAGLFKPPHQRNLPTLLLYDERGLRLYDDLTTHALEYYLFAAEEQILTDHAKEIVEFMGVQGDEKSVVVELGAGSLRKTSHILLALANSVAEPTSAAEAPITYYALDLERKELLRTLGVVSSTIGSNLAGRVATKGMWGTYDGGLAFIRTGGLAKDTALEDDVDRITQRCGEANIKDPHPIFTTTSSQTPTPRPSSPAVEDDETHSASDHHSGSYDHDASTNMSTHTPLTSQPAEEEGIRITVSRPASPSSQFGDTSGDHTPLHILFLGSSLGNFPRPDAVDFLKSLPLRPGSGDTLLLGLDHRNDGKTIELAYNDPAGWTTKFELNGLRVAERVLQGRGDEVDRDYGEIFKKDGWTYEGKWNEVEGRHESYFRSTKKQVVIVPPDIDRPQDPETPVQFEEGELVRIEYCNKYSDPEALALFSAANLRVVNRWTDKKGMYSMWLLERPPFTFPRVRSPSSTTTTAATPATTVSPSQPLTHLTSFPPVPTLGEWSALWSLWDLITLGMIPPSMLHTKPIDLRHKCLFYLGHIPTFLDIHLTRVLRRMGKKEEGHTEPEYFKDIFERGIDPHVDDPSVIHPHSEVPDKDEDWPALGEVLAFRDRVRARLIRVYEEYGVEREGESTVRDFPRALARVLWMTWEHEAFHAETLLYMLIQKAGDADGTLPPPGFAKPQWETLKNLPGWSQPLPALTVTLEAGSVEISLGHDDIEADDSFDQVNSPTHEFGWDNESPKRSAKLGEKAVRVETRPILNGEFYDFWIKERKAGGHDLPGLWVVDSEENVKVRTLYGPVPLSVAANWPFAGAYDDLVAFAKWKGGRLPTEVELRTYMDRYEGSEESNIGFKNWHPVPPQLPNVENGLRGHNGGVWEWAETLFDEYQGFEKSVLYPGYSSDFFDGKHQVVLGGSYATVPRLAQRRSLRNWYQHNYPYAWIGGRVVYDV
ncbi:hypothetical protein FRC04_005739 [Tulasnella sp. 424]|nr:hypothetical protein FRC04_005739 [Tulasnella sp. 424]KAG8977529.1 hypothetical protein FRC05_001387 [Tulasnella sp. 425]